MIRLLLALALLLPVALAAQYDERQILLQQAQGHEMRQRYEQANELYVQLAEQHPGDVTVINRLVRNLLQLSREDEAAEVLRRHKSHLPDLAWTQMMLQVQLKAGDIEEARESAWAYLRENPDQQTAYREFAGVFAGFVQPEVAIEMYRAGREQADDPTLYSLDLARAWQQSRRFDRAIEEYVAHLASNAGYLHYVANQTREMLDEDRRLLRDIERLADDDATPQVRELLALSHVHLGQMDEAFAVYSTLEPMKLKRFADEQFNTDNLEVALRAYRGYLEREDRPHMRADARLAMARVYSSLGRPDSTRAVLLRLYHDETLRSPRMRQVTRANQVTREMLSDLALADGNYAAAEEYLREAVEFTPHPEERRLSQLRLVRLYTLLERYGEAEQLLGTILEGQPDDSEVALEALHIRWQSHWLRAQSMADSLLNDMLVKTPGNPGVDDALLLTLLTLEAGPQAQSLRQAVRLHGLYRVEEASRLLAKTDQPLLVLLAADWARQAGLSELARRLYSREWEDADNRAYADLRLAGMSGAEGRRERVTAFLNQQPSHPFSPLFRELLKTTASPRR